VTSPPYNLGVDYGAFPDNVPHEAYLRWMLEWCSEMKRVLKSDGSFFLTVGAAPSNPMLPHEVICSLPELFLLQNTLHWIKSITIKPRDGEEVSAGHFKPINSKRYITDCHEFVFHLTPLFDWLKLRAGSVLSTLVCQVVIGHTCEAYLRFENTTGSAEPLPLELTLDAFLKRCYASRTNP